MVHNVQLFIDGIHFGIAIQCADGWYKFQYAAGGASGLSGSLNFGSFGKTSNKVTIKRTPPTGKVILIGQTSKGLDSIINYARKECGFDDSPYGLTDNNCRIFCAKLADFLEVYKGYCKASQGYWFAQK